MRKLGLLVIVGHVALAMGCSSSSNSGSSGTGGSLGATGGAAATGGQSATGGVANTGGTRAAATGGTSAAATGGPSSTATGGTSAPATGGTNATAGGGSSSTAAGETGTSAGGSSAASTGGTTAADVGGSSSEATGGSGGVAGGTKAAGGSRSTATGGSGGAAGSMTNASAGTATAGGTTATPSGGTVSGTGGSTAISTCVIPSCLSNLFTSGCVGTGACVYQEVDGASTNSENTCFSNGVKWLGIDNYSNEQMTVTVTNGSVTCYSMEYWGNDVMNAVDVLTVKDASGAVVATEAIDPVTYSGTIVTCTGGSPVELAPSCSGTPADLNTIMNMGQDCNTGSCSQ